MCSAINSYVGVTHEQFNILACIAVITLHHNGLAHSFQDNLAWKESLLAECIFYWAVPVFFMISGANLLDYRKRYSTTEFFKKRIIRTVIPWLSWSIILLIIKNHTGQLKFETGSFRDMINVILNFQVSSIYWFFGSIFACYLATPVFSLLTEHRSILWYTVIINFIFLSCLPIIGTWSGVTFTLAIPILSDSFIYYILGYLLKDGVSDKRKRIIIYCIGSLCVCFRYIYTYINSIKNESTDVSIKGYRTFHAVLFSVAVYIFLRQISIKSKKCYYLINNHLFTSDKES